MSFLTEKLNFTKQTITEMKFNSKEFYNKIKERITVREFQTKKIYSATSSSLKTISLSSAVVHGLV